MRPVFFCAGRGRADRHDFNQGSDVIFAANSAHEMFCRFCLRAVGGIPDTGSMLRYAHRRPPS
ncbi:hypothetical protein A9Q95_08955 [Rhodobacterales bacterium 59_46_T64]|nr:hypothetical protein A9Q95_08955 [Rhodobacterales bacterium 59_46_T64]